MLTSCIFFGPKFQCQTGHVICSSCLDKLVKKNECPTCRSYVGNNRNIAIEKVLQSIAVTCKNSEYGCEEKTSLDKIHDHEKKCEHVPCSCPLANCNFLGSSTKLYQHFTAEHSKSVVQFQYDKYFKVSLKAKEKFLGLQEEKDDSVLFVLHNTSEKSGRSLSINCICSKYVRKRYKIRASFGSEYSLKSGAITSSSKRCTDYSSLGNLRVPLAFFAKNGRIHLAICIYKDNLPD